MCTGQYGLLYYYSMVRSTVVQYSLLSVRGDYIEGIHCLPATSLAANENHFRCFASCTSSSTKNSFGVRECLRKFLYSLESHCFSSGFLTIVDHGAWEKAVRGWTCRVRLTRGQSPSSVSSFFTVSQSSYHVPNQSPPGQGPGSAPFLVG